MKRRIAHVLVWLVAFCAALVARQVVNQESRPRSFNGPEGHTMVAIHGGEFVMGSPLSERGRSEDETAHRVRIPRTYTIATAEVTNEQFGRFLAAAPAVGARWKVATAARFGDPSRLALYIENA